MRRISGLLYAIPVMLALVFQACSDDGDDVEMIFTGKDKSWYVTGLMYNGVGLNGEEVKEFYSNPYYLKFDNNSVSGALATGSELVGYWSADGDSRRLTIKIQHYTAGKATPLSTKVFDIIKNATSYSGDSNVMKIKKDANNYIMLNAKAKQ